MKAVYSYRAPESVHACTFPFRQCILSRIRKDSYTLLHLVFVDQQHPLVALSVI